MNKNVVFMIPLLVTLYGLSNHPTKGIGSYINFSKDQNMVTAADVGQDVIDDFWDYIDEHTVQMGRFIYPGYYYFDVTGDGRKDLCTSVTHGSGIVSTGIFVYDIKNEQGYELQERGDYDYWIDSIEDNTMYIRKGKFGRKDNDQSKLGILEFSDGALKYNGPEVPGRDKDHADNDIMNQEIHEAFFGFINGDRSCVDKENELYIPDFINDTDDYEYMFLDIDKDGEDELIIQTVNDPGYLNAVYDYKDGNIRCWYIDSIEMTCFNYPLKNGRMVQKYLYDDSVSYAVFEYKEDGTYEIITSLFCYECSDPYDEMIEHPYYEIDSIETNKEAYERTLKNMITNQEFDRSDWTAITGE